MRVVLDSNIFFSAFLTPCGVPMRIVQAWRDGDFELITSRHQIEEIRRVSRYDKFKAYLRPFEVGRLINALRRDVVLERLAIREEADDPDDSFLLAMAVAGEADYLVTGDRHAGLLKMKRFGRTRIIAPAPFLRALATRR